VGVKMTTEEFRAFQRLILDSAGLAFEDGAKDRLERRLMERLAATGSRDFADYYLQLARGSGGAAQEMERMLELCVTHETYFFREPRQLRALEQEIIPALAQEIEKVHGRKRIRLWSAGCSTGEEPYTLAIILLRSPFLRGYDVEVLGTDLSQRALARARRGIYGPSSFRDVEAGVMERYFRKLSGPDEGSLEVKPEVKQHVTWGRLNLWAAADVGVVGQVDAILCRNVLIYFDREGKRRVVEHLHDRLKPGGWLLLGHSESLLAMPTRLDAVSLSHDLVYRRPPLTPDPHSVTLRRPTS
jgi:chemotaxis protein methyltransferase CheR